MDYIGQYGEWYCNTCRQYQQEPPPSKPQRQDYDDNHGPTPSEPLFQDQSTREPDYYGRPPSVHRRGAKKRKVPLIVTLIVVGVIVITGTIVGLYFALSEGEDFTKEGALKFGLKIVKTYFDNDIAEFKSYLDDEIFCLDGDGPISRAEVIADLDVSGYVVNEDYTEHTYQEYLDTYDPYVMDIDEIKAEFNELVELMISKGWDFDDDDYIFMGWKTKSGNQDDGFLWDDPLAFGITHEGGEWAFKAFSG